MSTERFLETDNERLRARFNEAYRTTERIRTVLYGTDWTDRFGQLAGSTKALLDELRRVFQDDQPERAEASEVES